MRKIHKATTLAALLNVAAITCLFPGYFLIASLLFLIAFFAAISELSVYTSYYQFIFVFSSAILTGLSLDLACGYFPVLTLALFFAASACLARVVFFKRFFYTAYSWFEPVNVVLSLVIFLCVFFQAHVDWKAFLVLPVILFSAVFAWGTVKDKQQLLSKSLKGYNIIVGKQASEFALSDQDGQLTKLSDYRNKRHVLLIFVRGDWCPGCHMMLRAYEKNNAKFQSKHVMVLAIGPDPVGVNREMVEKLGLDFKVLSDEGQHTAMTYGVQLKEYDNRFSDTYQEGIPLPASFLIDKKGIVRYVSRPDKVGEFLNPSLIFPIVEQLS